MTTYLYSLLTAGGDRMAVNDPHGFTLTLISVSVVFVALIILYFIYSFIGDLNTGKFKRKPKAPKTAKGSPDAETAIAIALALEAEMGSETEVAIATALHLYLSECVHDAEPGIITIRKNDSAWGNKSLTFRRKPQK